MSTESSTGSTLVVTLWETYGCGMQEIAVRVAAELGLHLHQQAFSSEDIEAREAQSESQGLFSRIVAAIGSATPNNESDALPATIAASSKSELVTKNTETVIRSAREGGIILGRNATVILAHRPRTLHVKLDGSKEFRIQNAATLRGISPDRATKRQETEDKVRADMSIDLYRWDPRTSEAYDLVLNVGTFDQDTVVKMIVDAAHAVE